MASKKASRSAQRAELRKQEQRQKNRTRDLRRLTTQVKVKTRPRTAQAKMRTVPKTPGNGVSEYVFPFVPIQIQYENLAPEFVEIERPGNIPYVDRKSYRLLKVSLQFLVARPYDGYNESVDADLRLLRSMANSLDPVMFTGLDGMLTNPFNIPQLSLNRPNAAFFFRIAELSVQSVRRNTNNEITAAEVSISLIEDPGSRATVISFPSITYPDLLKPTTKAKSGSKSGSSDSYKTLEPDITKKKEAPKVTVPKLTAAQLK